MIAGIFHKGSGLGNQLHRYVFVRCLALDKGYAYGFKDIENFKGSSFLKIDLGEPVGTLPHRYTEPTILHSDKITDVRSYDFEGVASIQDNTLIDGEFQGENYFIHRKKEIYEWLKTEPLSLPENLCIINFRGGEYVGVKDLFLPQKYWDNAISNMRKINSNMKFSIVTDDTKTAKKFFPNFEITHNLKDDYAKIQNAYYLILSNSSFAILPAWLNKNLKLAIAPKYWARHNVSNGYWALDYNIVDGWMYQDREGKLHNYNSCVQSLKEYKSNKIEDTSLHYFAPLSLKKIIAQLLPPTIKKFLKKI